MAATANAIPPEKDRSHPPQQPAATDKSRSGYRAIK